MSVRLVQPISTNVGADNCAYALPVTNGSLLIAGFMAGTAAGGATDTLKNVWSVATEVTANALDAGIMYAVSAASGPNTVTIAAGDIWLWEIAWGFALPTKGGVAVRGVTTSGSAVSGTAVDPGSVTASYLNHLIVSCVAGTKSISAGASGWVFGAESSMGHACQYIIPQSVAALDGVFTLSGIGNWTAVSAVFGFIEGNSAACVQPKAKPFLL